MRVRAQHDHAATKRKLRMGNASVIAGDDQMAIEAESVAQEIHGGRGIAITQGGNDRRPGVLCEVRHLEPFPRAR